MFVSNPGPALQWYDEIIDGNDGAVHISHAEICSHDTRKYNKQDVMQDTVMVSMDQLLSE